ncbi:hypothetical protein D3C84_1125370 [compost metagenome]
MFVEQFDQTVDANGQLLHREGHVFDDHRGSGFAYCPDGRKGVFADRPEPGVFPWVLGKVDLFFHREAGQGGHDPGQLLLQ